MVDRAPRCLRGGFGGSSACDTQSQGGKERETMIFTTCTRAHCMWVYGDIHHTCMKDVFACVIVMSLYARACMCLCMRVCALSQVMFDAGPHTHAQHNTHAHRPLPDNRRLVARTLQLGWQHLHPQIHPSLRAHTSRVALVNVDRESPRHQGTSRGAAISSNISMI